MRRRTHLRLTIAASALAASLLLAAPPLATSAIHEMVAAYCSGGGHGAIGADGFFEPPGITDMTKQNFARPVNANGVVEFPLITNRPPAKFPAGTNVLTLTVA